MTIQSLRRASGFALVLAASSLLLMGASGGCGSDLHKAVVAADAVGTSLSTAAAINHEASVEGIESPAEREAVAGYILSAAQANDVFVSQLQAAEAAGIPVTATQIASAFTRVIDAVSLLQNEGVLHLKNPNAQARFAAIIATIQTELQLIYALTGSAAPSPTLPAPVVLPTAAQLPPRKGDRPVAPDSAPHRPEWLAITLTATEVEELLVIVTAAIGEGAALVRKLQGLSASTDAELLADAGVQDAAAEKQATADESGS